MACAGIDKLAASPGCSDISAPKFGFSSFSHHHSASGSLKRPFFRTTYMRQQLALIARADATAVRTSTNSIGSSSEIDWDNLGFGYHETDFMFFSKCGVNGEWDKGEIQPFGHLKLSPSAGILNYGQGIFEGLKAYRTENGRILLFRPEENAMRMIAGADRLCMPALPINLFVQAVKQTVMANERWIPPSGKGSLYIRPLLFGSGAVLGLAPAPEYSFVIFVAPVGNYFRASFEILRRLRIYISNSASLTAVHMFSLTQTFFITSSLFVIDGSRGHTGSLMLFVLGEKHIFFCVFCQ